ncbi:MAG: DUF2520 domain-containing protein [Arcanobacterium sp.]|nr:DUF2520 domain-containing protein [Arcanobacterium sp.]
MNSGRMGIGIISAGKVGAALGSGLRSLGHTITGAYASSDASIERLETMLPGVPNLQIEEIVSRSEVVLLAVPDDQLAPLISGLAKLNLWQPGQILIHTAGRYGTEVFAPVRNSGAIGIAMHPAMTFTGTSLDVARLQGCPFAITAPAAFQAIGIAIAAELGGEPVVIAEGDRIGYHAALAYSANYLVTLVNEGMTALRELGIPDSGAYLRPLLSAALEGALSSGDALQTGPIVRGDYGTVAAHLAVIDEMAEGISNLKNWPENYRQLGKATIDRAHERGIVSDFIAQEITDLLTINPGNSFEIPAQQGETEK